MIVTKDNHSPIVDATRGKEAITMVPDRHGPRKIHFQIATHPLQIAGEYYSEVQG